MKVKNDKWIVKIMCALGAIVLWVLVMTKVNPMFRNNYNNIKVNISNLSALESQDYVLMNDNDDFTVDVKVYGLKNNVLKLNYSDIKASIDLNDIVADDKEGVFNLPVKIQNIDNIEITGYSPIYIPCKIEKKITKSVAVRVKYEGVQKDGYYVSSVGVSNPSSVLIKGPRSVVDSAAYAIAIVNVDGENEVLSRTEPVRIFNDQDIEITTLTVNPFTVDIALPIYPTKTVPVIAQVLGTPKEGYKMTEVNSELGTVTIAAPKEVLDVISEIKTEPIDITDANVDIIAEKDIIAENGVIITDGNYKTKVTASIDRIIDKTFLFNFDDIELQNLDEQFIAALVSDDEPAAANGETGGNTEDDTNTNNEGNKQNNNKDNQTNNEGNANKTQIKVTITDVASVISTISKDDIKLSIDLSEAIEGINEYTIIYKIEQEVETITIEPQVIKIKVELKPVDEGTDGGENQ